MDSAAPCHVVVPVLPRFTPSAKRMSGVILILVGAAIASGDLPA
jgi:hypothetical protein